MDVKNNEARFSQAIASLSPKLRQLLSGTPDTAKRSAFEIRLRVGRPVMLTCPSRSWFVDANARLMDMPQNPYLVTPADIADCVVSMCAHSVHSHQEEMRSGFISLRGGHRAGICGAAVIDERGISAVREITSINLRIAREVAGAADALIERIFLKKLCGVLIIGIPSSGKTTILRDLVRQLASGRTGQFLKVAVVDERGELGAVFDGVVQNDLGYCSDILSGYPKAEGIMAAVRTLSPDVIVCDEIGGAAEAGGILDGLNSGVKVVATAHAASIDEAIRRPQIRRLLESGAFEKIARLGGAQKPGEIRQIVEVGELFDQDLRHGDGRSMLFDDGNFRSVGIIEAGCDA